MRVLSLVLSVVSTTAIPSFVDGIAQPRGLFAGESALWVAAAGNGGYGDESQCGVGPEGPGCFGMTSDISYYLWDRNIMFGGERTVIANQPSWAAASYAGNALGMHDVHVDEDGIFWLSGGIPTPNTATPTVNEAQSCKLWWSPANQSTPPAVIADFYAYEWAHNPDAGMLDCDPFRFARAQDGAFIVTDAAANTIYRATVQGVISVIAVWERTSVPDPFAPPNNTMMEAVPTGVAIGHNGEIYVGNLAGFPFPTGGSEVRQYDRSGEYSVIGTGFTSIQDIAVDKDGNIWVLEMSPSLLLLMGPSPPAPFGALTRIDRETGEQTKFLNTGEIMLASGLAISPVGDFYIGNLALGGFQDANCPEQCIDSGSILKWTPPAPTPPPTNQPSGTTVINFNFRGLLAQSINEPI